MNGKLSIAEIRTMQSGDINHLSDDIYFNGCTNRCAYCFNPELREFKAGNYTVEEIVAQLSDVEWVCLIGGEPLEQGYEDLQELIDVLRWRLGKKVCVFTSFGEPWKFIEADHYHIHLNIAFGREYRTNVSYGYVSFYLTEKMMEYTLINTDKRIPIYVKTCLGYEEASNADTNAMYISSVLGFTNVQVDGVIDVD